MQEARIIPQLSLVRNDSAEREAECTVGRLRERLRQQFQRVEQYALDPQVGGTEDSTFKIFEGGLIPLVWEFGRLAIALFLAAAHQRVSRTTGRDVIHGDVTYRKEKAPAGRNLETTFGVVRYFRDYLRPVVRSGKRAGYHPLDQILGLTKERISMTLLALCVRMATKFSFAEARNTLGWFLPVVPSTEVIEQATLGFGRYTEEWFEHRPVSDGDGEVLIVLIDSKGAPMATATELAKRRGKRKKGKKAKSPRHRGRQRRKLTGKKPRRKKGDKSKNAKMATMVVMYTLKREGRHLLGPINRLVYASFAPKRHAFLIARREANKRGFTPDSGKLIQLLTDGDPDLAVYKEQYFKGAIHTADAMHVVEYLWKAGAALHGEATPAQRRWVEKQKARLYGGHADKIVLALKRKLAQIPKQGPGNKGKRKRLAQVIDYLNNRVHMMNYDELLRKDLEIGTGAVEGAIKYVIGRRCDHGGMRWIKERAEAVVQLRCIDLNGDWDAFGQHVHDSAQQSYVDNLRPVRIQQAEPAPLPAISQEAA